MEKINGTDCFLLGILANKASHNLIRQEHMLVKHLKFMEHMIKGYICS